MGVKEIWTQRATICSGKLEPVTEPKGASVAWYKRIKTGGVKGNLIQSCCSGICCFETTSQCMQAACQDPILHCHEYSPGLVNQKNCTIPNQMPEASAVMNSTKALYNPSLVSKGGTEIGKNIYIYINPSTVHLNGRLLD